MNASADPKVGSGRSIGRLAIIAAPLVAFGALAALFLLRLEQGGDPTAVPSVLVGRPAPKTELPPLAGSGLPGIAAADLAAGGKPTLVNVWASWCVPCREEHPILEKLGADPRIRLIGINYKDQGENALRFLGQFGNPFAAVGVDASGRTAIDWGVYGVPETFLLDGEGVVRYKFIGPLSEEGLTTALLPEIEKLLPKR
jgi:cytochrome c biogenesis protein CcmG/thiol:disulfide interchange protein DsbE